MARARGIAFIGVVRFVTETWGAAAHQKVLAALPAENSEVACVLDGSPYCEFRVQWVWAYPPSAGPPRAGSPLRLAPHLLGSAGGRALDMAHAARQEGREVESS
jgi:hypothetical protein